MLVAIVSSWMTHSESAMTQTAPSYDASCFVDSAKQVTIFIYKAEFSPTDFSFIVLFKN